MDLLRSSKNFRKEEVISFRHYEAGAWRKAEAAEMMKRAEDKGEL